MLCQWNSYMLQIMTAMLPQFNPYPPTLEVTANSASYITAMRDGFVQLVNVRVDASRSVMASAPFITSLSHSQSYFTTGGLPPNSSSW
jgi:hypothetical protein